jgi:predicted DNA-binding transcriptional regulator YafY
MTIDRRAIAAAIPLSLFFAGRLRAEAKRKDAETDDRLSWDGVWSGNWGGQESEATSIMIVNNNVVSFDYHGESTPISASVVTPTTVSYEHNWVTVTMTRTGPTTATATLHSMMGDTTAELTRR